MNIFNRDEFMSRAVTLAIEELESAKRELEEAKSRYEQATTAVVELASVQGQKSLTYRRADGTGYKATVVASERTSFNESGLKKAIGARLFNKLCKVSLDKAKLEQAVRDDLVDPVVVAQFATITAGTPYVRLSEIRLED